MTTSKQTYGLESAKPPVCSPAVVSTEVDGEFVVVNTETNEAHALEGDVATVWRAVQAGTKPDLPGERSDEIVDALVERGLLIVEEGYSRRSVLKAGAAAFAVAGITSIALPAGALAAASHTFTSNNTITLNSKQTTNFTLIGGGGGGGASDGMGAGGGAGGAGGIVYGTITNNGGDAVLTIDIGGGGSGGIMGTKSTGGASSFSAGGGADNNGGGGGGGASAILAPGSTVLIIAGGGAGGTFDSSQGIIAVTPSAGNTGTPAAGSGMSGAGGGGGGGTPGQGGDTGGKQPLATGGTSYPAASLTIGNFMIALNTGSDPGSGSAAGAAGTGATFVANTNTNGVIGGTGEAYFSGGVS